VETTRRETHTNCDEDDAAGGDDNDDDEDDAVFFLQVTRTRSGQRPREQRGGMARAAMHATASESQ
jgi:hypothetical protein